MSDTTQAADEQAPCQGGGGLLRGSTEKEEVEVLSSAGHHSAGKASGPRMLLSAKTRCAGCCGSSWTAKERAWGVDKDWAPLPKKRTRG